MSSDGYSGKRYPRLADDMPTFLGVPHAVTKDDLKGADVVIIGAPYVAGWGSDFAGVGKEEWLASPKRVR
jgi:agmatinase